MNLILGHPRCLKPGDRVVDVMWVLASPEVFVKLTGERGWSVDSYQSWLV